MIGVEVAGKIAVTTAGVTVQHTDSGHRGAFVGVARFLGAAGVVNEYNLALQIAGSTKSPPTESSPTTMPGRAWSHR